MYKCRKRVLEIEPSNHFSSSVMAGQFFACHGRETVMANDDFFEEITSCRNGCSDEKSRPIGFTYH